MRVIAVNQTLLMIKTKPEIKMTARVPKEDQNTQESTFFKLQTDRYYTNNE